MSLFRKLTDAFSDNKTTSSSAGDDRDQVIREAKKRTRLIQDGDWIKSKTSSDESSSMPADVNYGKSALSPVKSEESLNSDPNSKLRSTTKSDTIDGSRSGTADPSKTQRSSTLDRPASDSGSTNVTSPTSKYSSLDRKNRNYSYKTEETPTMTIITSENKAGTDSSKSYTDPTSKSGFGATSPKRTSPFKTDDLPKMTIITSETKNESPTSKRPTPDGQVTTQEKSPAKPILKWGSQKDETSGSGNMPRTSTLERNTAKTSDFMSKFGSKSLSDLSITPEKQNKGTPTSTAPDRTSSLVDLSPLIPDKPQRNSGERDNTSTYTITRTKATYDPTSRNSRSSGDWDNTNSYTTTTKTTFDPSNNEDWDNTSSNTTTSTKTTYDPTSRNSRSSGDWENTSSYTTANTRTSPDISLKSTRSSSEHAAPNDEPSGYKSPTSYTKTSKTFSSGSLTDKSPVRDAHLDNSRSSYKENSPPSEQLSDGDEPSAYQSPSYSLQKKRNSSSSLPDGKGPSKVITITTGFSSAEQTSMDKNLCSQCYKPINKGAKMILEELNINCHAACFKCQICKASLENLNAGDNFWVHRRTVHCEPCYDKVKAQRSY